MARRIFGPVLGAGTQLEELEGDRQISQAALGYWAHAGLYEKGMVGELNAALGKKQFLKKLGSYIADSQAPDAAIDAYDGAAGAGGGFYIRVTDGNELQAEYTLYARRGALLTAMGTLKAKNGGRWGGKYARYTAEVADISDFAETAVTTGVATWKTDQWKGAVLEHPDVPNTQYEVIGNTAAGVINLATDSTLDSDIGAGTDKRYYLKLDNEEKALSVEVRDGVENPTSEFGLFVYVDEELVLQYKDLHTDPAHKRYWVDVINEDTGNDEVEAVDLWTGAHVADVRPANHYGIIDTVTATVLTALISDFAINSPGGGDPTFALGTTTDAFLAQKITITMTAATDGDAVSDKLGALGTVTLGALFDPGNGVGGANLMKWAPPFTVTVGGSPLVATDTLVINYKPFDPDSLIGGFVYPDKPNAARVRFRIVDNDHATITAADGSDMTDDGAPADSFMAIAALDMAGGRDGNADVADSDYTSQAWDTDSSPFHQLRDKGLGLVKMATPSVTSTAVQKAGVAYASARNHQYRYEAPSNILTEVAADAYYNDTLGRNDYAVTSFPSWGYVADPEGEGEGKLKLTILTGQIHGREAAMARDNLGYHKAAAGEIAVLPKILKLPTGDAVLNEEYLNPLGINVVKKIKGNFVLWGDRTLWSDPLWIWKHQREQMSHYENQLMESFGWITFAINDPATQPLAYVALQSFFLPEWKKLAIRGNSLEDAVIIKIDNEINTDATRAAGDMFAELKPRLADTVERFRIRIGKQGIFESAA